MNRQQQMERAKVVRIGASLLIDRGDHVARQNFKSTNEARREVRSLKLPTVVLRPGETIDFLYARTEKVRLAEVAKKEAEEQAQPT